MLTKEQLAEYETAHKKIGHIIVDKDSEIEVVLRKPTRAEWKRFRANAVDDNKKADANEILWRQIVIYPSKEAFDALLEDFPGLCESPGSTALIASLCGMVGEASLKL